MELHIEKKRVKRIALRLGEDLYNLLSKRAKEEKTNISEVLRALVRTLDKKE